MADENSKLIVEVEFDSKSASRKLGDDVTKTAKKAAKLVSDNNKKADKEASKSLEDQNKELKKTESLLKKLNGLWATYNKHAAHAGKRGMVPGSPYAPTGGGGSPPNRGPGGGGGPGGSRNDPTATDKIVDAIKRATFSAAGGYMGLGLQYFKRGYQERVDLNKDMSRIAYMGESEFGGSTDNAFDRLRQGERYGYTAHQTLDHAAGLGRATGGIKLLSTIQALSRETGTDIGQMTGFAGTMRRAGSNVNDEKGARNFRRIMEQAVKSGLDKSRTGEHLDAVSGLIQQGQSVTAGVAPTSQVSAMLAALGHRLGVGFQGERGAATLSKFDQAIKGGGGSDASKAFMMQAFGFGRPGGGASFGDVTRRMQRGILGGPAGSGAQNFVDLLNYARESTGGGEETSYMLSQMTGESMDRIDALLAAFQGPDGFASLTAEISKMQEAGKNPVDKLSTAVENFTSVARVDATRMNDRMKAITDEVIKQVQSVQDAIDELAESLTPLILSMVGLMKTLTPAINKLTEILGPIVDFAAGGVSNLMNPEFHRAVKDYAGMLGEEWKNSPLVSGGNVNAHRRDQRIWNNLMQATGAPRSMYSIDENTAQESIAEVNRIRAENAARARGQQLAQESIDMVDAIQARMATNSDTTVNLLQQLVNNTTPPPQAAGAPVAAPTPQSGVNGNLRQ